LDGDLVDSPSAGRDILAIDSAFKELAAIDPRLAEVVELRFFGGMTLAETAGMLGVSLATTNREWAMAKAWLQRRLRSP
jgi:DNA-directed RNA polymerase specialized sigma24 family protein